MFGVGPAASQLRLLGPSAVMARTGLHQMTATLIYLAFKVAAQCAQQALCQPVLNSSALLAYLESTHRQLVSPNASTVLQENTLTRAGLAPVPIVPEGSTHRERRLLASRKPTALPERSHHCRGLRRRTVCVLTAWQGLTRSAERRRAQLAPQVSSRRPKNRRDARFARRALREDFRQSLAPQQSTARAQTA